MLRFALLLLLSCSAALAQAPPIPPAAVRPDIDAGRMIRPPPQPLAVMREPPSVSAVAEELGRLGVAASEPGAREGRDRAAVDAALRRASPPPQPLLLPPSTDLRGAPLSPRAIIDALRQW
jgi:hypothetical protein